MNPLRRRLLRAAALALPGVARGEVAFPGLGADFELAFPRDHGSHPAFRTEWWYVTGWTSDASGTERGVQVTFFRSRPGVAESSRSAFAPRQLLFAHAAIADAQVGQLVHDQRAAREGFGVASAAEGATDVRLDRWTLAGDGSSWRTKVEARAFTLDLGFRATQPPLPQGEHGRSRKGPGPAQASGYYSVPQLAIDGSVSLHGHTHRVAGTAWLDHEWSSAYLAAEASGWDWIGINLDGGGALMAFRIRGRDGSTWWSGGTLRDDAGRVRTFGPGEVLFTPGRRWRSPRTGIEYPVTFEVRLPGLAIAIEPMMDDQELDARGSVGIVYWEGAVRASGAGRPLGRGYLELTGYGAPLKL